MVEISERPNIYFVEINYTTLHSFILFRVVVGGECQERKTAARVVRIMVDECTIHNFTLFRFRFAMVGARRIA